MNKPIKLPEIRKEAFTKARESLGLSTKDLSGMTCLSVRQIEQIENGKSSSFYGTQVKVTAAKKVASLLKLQEEDAFELGDMQVPANGSASEENAQEETKASAIEKNSNSEKAKEAKEVNSKPETTNAKNKLGGAADYRVKSKAKVSPQKKWFLLLAISAAMVFSVVNLRPLFFPEPVKEEIVVIQEVMQDPAPASSPAEPAVDTKPTTAAIPEPAPVTVSTECPSADTSALNYKPDTPKKVGDMVYIQSKTAQTVCVVDSAGKTQNKTLEPGIGVSVFGKPPLKVLTGGLNQVELYYQGAKVRLGSTSSKTIILEPAEIIQPLAPSTSSDSQFR